jgi:hypothetical protein
MTKYTKVAPAVSAAGSAQFPVIRDRRRYPPALDLFFAAWLRLYELPG